MEEKKKKQEEGILLKLSMPGTSLKEETIKKMKEKAEETPPDYLNPQQENNLTKETIEEPQEVVEEKQEITEEPPAEPIIEEEEIKEEPLIEPEIIEEEIPVEPAQENNLTKETIEEQEELLKKVTMSKKIETKKDQEEKPFETKKDPYIYRKGHPHLGSNYDMGTIKGVADKIYGSNLVKNRLKKKRK